MDRDGDGALIRRAREGDADAFEILVERHRAQAVRFVARRTGRPDLAEDAVQEALVAAHRVIATRPDEAPEDMRAWLSTVAWRRALDLMRGERSAVPLDPAAPSAAQGPDQLAIQAAELDSILGTWAGLPARQRDALAMSVLEGRSLREIADVLQIEPEAAKSLVARSRRTLTSRLAADDSGCEDIRDEILGAALRGVRLDGLATRHVRGCKECSRLHRHARRRRRVRAFVFAPYALVLQAGYRWQALRERSREIVVGIVEADHAIGVTAKVCAVACVTAATVPATQEVIRRVDDTPKPTIEASVGRPDGAKEREKKKAAAKKRAAKVKRAATSTPVRAATAAPTTVATTAPAPTVTVTPRQTAVVSTAGSGSSSPSQSWKKNPSTTSSATAAAGSGGPAGGGMVESAGSSDSSSKSKAKADPDSSEATETTETAGTGTDDPGSSDGAAPSGGGTG